MDLRGLRSYQRGGMRRRQSRDGVSHQSDDDFGPTVWTIAVCLPRVQYELAPIDKMPKPMATRPPGLQVRSVTGNQGVDGWG